MRVVRQVLEDPDFAFVRALKQGKQNFVITDPHLVDNPIVYATQGFLDLTGYSLDQVTSRERHWPDTRNTRANEPLNCLCALCLRLACGACLAYAVPQTCTPLRIVWLWAPRGRHWPVDPLIC